MSPLDPEVPPTGEEIHLPGPSLLPFLTGVAVTLVLVGLTINILITIAGGVMLIVCVVRWILDNRRDYDELPLG